MEDEGPEHRRSQGLGRKRGDWRSRFMWKKARPASVGRCVRKRASVSSRKEAQFPEPLTM